MVLETVFYFLDSTKVYKFSHLCHQTFCLLSNSSNKVILQFNSVEIKLTVTESSVNKLATFEPKFK